MKSATRILCALVIFLMGINVSSAQTLRKFSSEPDKYFEELYGFMTAQYEGGEALMNEFHAIWKIDELQLNEQEKVYKVANSALKKRMRAQGDSIAYQYGPSTKKLSEQQRKFIYKTSNALLKKRMKPSQFSSYLLTLINFETTGQTEASFDGWQASLNKLIEKARANKISAYLDFSNDLFADNLLYKSASVQWLSSNKNYSFEFDSLPKVTFQKLDLKCYSKGDSSIIYKTSGTYYPTSRVWIGTGGNVNWIRAGIAEDVVVATLSDYDIKVKSPTFTARKVNGF
ncbi:MAG: hypothetical protein JKX73_00955 [Flavobacteriales bacterium]|nr:hypothetical protein [Flavobacteriales bacterium]